MRPAGRISAFVLASALCGWATAQGLLKNVDFEADPVAGRDCPASWWCSVHSGTKSYMFEVASEAHSRGRFPRFSRVKNEPWAITTQTVKAAALKGRRVRMSASVYAEALEGKAGV